MAFTARGLRLAEVLKSYAKEKPQFFDTSNVIDKMKIQSINDEHLLASFKVDVSMCNGCGFLHGGYLASVIDVICLYAGMGRNHGRSCLTTNMNIYYLGQAKIGESVLAEAKTLKKGNSSLLEATVFKETTGDLIAKGTASFLKGDESFQKLTLDIINFDNLKDYTE